MSEPNKQPLELMDPTPITVEHLRELGFRRQWTGVWSLGKLDSHPPVSPADSWLWFAGSGRGEDAIPQAIIPTTLGELRQLMMRVQS